MGKKKGQVFFFKEGLKRKEKERENSILFVFVSWKERKEIHKRRKKQKGFFNTYMGAFPFVFFLILLFETKVWPMGFGKDSGGKKKEKGTERDYGICKSPKKKVRREKEVQRKKKRLAFRFIFFFPFSFSFFKCLLGGCFPPF